MIVTATGLSRSYGEGEATVHALAGVDVEFPGGAFTAIMGPSGSGKSTLMHLLAGLDRPTSGSVVLAGTELAGLGDKELTALRRDKVGFIFQSFNLLPVLSAEENILLPLSIAGRKPDQAWVDRLIDAVGLRERLGHRPAELSGGQQQRVALARALVLRPKVLLLDEPLGALDLKLRKEMQIELKRIQEEVGVTTIIVTHDQEEAMALADRIAVMDAGRIEQLDAPGVVYDRPATAFVAEFIGDLSFVDGTVLTGGEHPEVDCGAGIHLRAGRSLAPSAPGDRVRMGLRPEHVRAHRTGDGIPATIATTMVMGREVRVVCALPTGEQMVVLQGRGVDPELEHARSGDRVHVGWADDAPMLLGPAPNRPAPTPVAPAPAAPATP
mgnify:CR=1 FL=1